MDLNNIPNDQYSCTECNLVPEILTIHYEKGIIKFNCPNHKDKEMTLKEYFNKELTYLCNNCGKYFTQIKEKSVLNNIFNFCIKCKKNLCKKCSINHEHKSSFIKISESKIKCNTHLNNKFVKYCKECKTHFCKNDQITCNDVIDDIDKAQEIHINTIKNKRDNLIQKLEHFQRLIKFLDTLLVTYEKYPSNYFHYINIVNMALDIEDDNERDNEKGTKIKKKKKTKKLKGSENGMIDKKDNSQKEKITEKDKETKNEKEEIKENKDIKMNVINNKKDFINNKMNVIYNQENIINSSNQVKENKNTKYIENNNININKKEEKDKVININKETIQNNTDKLNIIEKPIINNNRENSDVVNKNDNQYNNDEDIIQKDIKLKEDVKRQKLFSKMNKLDKKIENSSKANLEIKIKDDALVIDLNGRNIDNIKLNEILGDRVYENLKTLILSHNNLKEIDNSLVNLNAPNLEELDLSNNKINNISPSKDLVLKHMKLKRIDLRHNSISNANILKDKVFRKKEILLSDNYLIKKDLEEIMNYLKDIENIGTIIYNLDINKDKVRIFGQGFVSKNKKFCKIIINDREMDITEFYSYNKKDIKEGDNLTIEIKIKFNGDVTSFYSLFKGCSDLVSILDFSEWDTSQITDTSYMFSGCKSLTSLSDISKWNTSEVTNMTNMFSECKSLTELPDISTWEVSKVNDMSFMFSKCELLESLPEINKWNVTSVKNMSGMFYECKNLKIFPTGEEDGEIWKTGSVNNMNCMFFKCSSLSDIGQIEKWNISKVINKENMFTGCRLIKKKIPKKFLI